MRKFKKVSVKLIASLIAVIMEYFVKRTSTAIYSFLNIRANFFTASILLFPMQTIYTVAISFRVFVWTAISSDASLGRIFRQLHKLFKSTKFSVCKKHLFSFLLFFENKNLTCKNKSEPCCSLSNKKRISNIKYY